MTETIHVTAQDIVGGVPRSCEMCPVALAARRLWPGATVGVDGDRIYRRSYSYGNASVRLPSTVRRWVREYDHGFPVAPFEFAIATPDILR